MAKALKKTEDFSDLGAPVVDNTAGFDDLGSPVVNPYDIQSNTAEAVSSGAGSPAQGNIAEYLMKKAAALYGGAGQGASLGYAENKYPKEVKEAMKGSPVTSYIGQIIGGIPTGAVPELALGKAGMEAGILRNLFGGAATGAAYNPGESPDPSSQRIIGGMMGATLGGAMGGAGNLGRAYETYRSFGKPGTADQVMSQVESALSAAEQEGFRNPARKASNLMAEGSVQVNPDQLKGITPALDRFVENRILPKSSGAAKTGMMGEKFFDPYAGYADVPGREANILRKYLDKVAEFRKSKLYAEPNAISEPAEKAAVMLRSKTQAINPEIPALQKMASKNKGKVDIIRSAMEGGPIEGLVSGELGTRGSILADLDKIVAQNPENANIPSLVELADKLRAGRMLSPTLAPQSFYRPAEMAVRGAGVVGGAAASPFTKYSPPGSSNALINLLMELQRPAPNKQ